MASVPPPPGRGLAALIPEVGPADPPTLPAGFAAFIDSVHQQNLDVLAERFDLPVAIGYHRPRQGTDRVYVAAPDFERLAPTRAMELFDHVRRVLDQSGSHHRLETEQGSFVGVVSAGPQSRSAYLLSEPSGQGDTSDAGDPTAELVDAARGMGDLVHSLEATMRRPDPAHIVVAVEPAESGAHRVQVDVQAPDVEPVPSVVVGPSVMESAAVAAARTIDSDARLLTLRRTDVGPNPMVLAVVSLGGRAPTMAIASLRDGENAAAARAAYRAAAFAV